MRLRTACDLELVDELHITCPKGFSVPEAAELGGELATLIRACVDKELFAPEITELTFAKRK
ncbi:MAG: hypothetical protein IT307_13835 [Chloroflexi bacterium]|nr:hypothetical protein [Chloroflexota bacterium]